jgi:hypothetical protein
MALYQIKLDDGLFQQDGVRGGEFSRPCREL